MRDKGITTNCRIVGNNFFSWRDIEDKKKENVNVLSNSTNLDKS